MHFLKSATKLSLNDLTFFIPYLMPAYTIQLMIKFGWLMETAILISKRNYFTFIISKPL